MSKFENVKQKNPSLFLRDVGISLEIFLSLVKKIDDFIKKQKEKKPMTRRGLKPKMSIEDKLLLTIYYLRHYGTFIKLGEEFQISESYANKTFHKITNILIKVLKLKNRNDLLNRDLGDVLIDATEQPIERPKKNQKKYYSGKKNGIL